MTNVTMTNDDFAKFIANEILSIKNYNFDMMYDIKKIVIEFNKYRGISEKPIETEYHLMLRETGCDLVEPSDELYKTYKQRNDKIFSLLFCWNCYYMHKKSYCIVNQLN